jgi:hypothetical protein
LLGREIAQLERSILEAEILAIGQQQNFARA